MDLTSFFSKIMYNTKFHTTTKMSPFEALYNLVEVVAYIVNTQESILPNFCKLIYKKAQERMEMYADLKWVDKEFQC